MFKPGDYADIWRIQRLLPVLNRRWPCRILIAFEKGKPYYFLRSEADGSRIYTPMEHASTLARARDSGRGRSAAVAASHNATSARPTPMTAKPCCCITRQLMQPHTCQALACQPCQEHPMPASWRLVAHSQRGAEILKKAEQLLVSELSAALNLSYNETQSRVRKAMQ